MRSFRIEINGTLYTVSVENMGNDKFQATLNDAKFEAETTSSGVITSWLVRGSSETIHAQAKNLPNDRVDVWLACTPFPAGVQPVGTGGYTVTSDTRRNLSGGQVRALMPGRITSVLVQEEDSVSEGAPLLILEAMKMQNEITSPVDGRVKAVFVHEGETVKKDAALLLIEPQE
jgi:biotin carboxyl carrier protein